MPKLCVAVVLIEQRVMGAAKDLFDGQDRAFGQQFDPM